MRHICDTRTRIPASLCLSLSLAALAAAAGCASQADDPQPTASNVLADNGLRGMNGLRRGNGFDPSCGLNLSSGLGTLSGLSSTSGLMTTADGRTTVSYLVKCALPAGQSIVKQDQNGVNYTFPGSLGLASAWGTSSCGQTCQMWVSACMLSMVNTTGMHYPIWIDGQPATVGWGQNISYPYQEGSFFGNLFTSSGPAYYCEGRDFGVKPIPGRIGSLQETPPYTDINVGTKCTAFCTPADYPHADDGSKACSGWNQVLTVWHQ